MTGINLLPWREERRRERDRQMISASVLILILCAAAIFAGYSYTQMQQDNQERRNNYLNSEINKLNDEIKEIRELSAQKENLVARMQLIQNLQQQRTQIVHLFDDLVRKLPEGVYYRSLQKKNDTFILNGTAQSNARVSDLMNRLDSSEWFANPDLNVINVTPTEGVRLSEFHLNVSEEDKSLDEEVDQEEAQ